MSSTHNSYLPQVNMEGVQRKVIKIVKREKDYSDRGDWRNKDQLFYKMEEKEVIYLNKN